MDRGKIRTAVDLNSAKYQVPKHAIARVVLALCDFRTNQTACGLLLPWYFAGLFTMTGYISMDLVAIVATPLIRRSIDVEKVTHIRLFGEHFGVSPWVTACVWNKLLELQLVPNRAQVKHLLWTLLFFKVYATEQVLSSICECNAETYRIWVRRMLDALGQLKRKVVSPLIDRSVLL